MKVKLIVVLVSLGLCGGAYAGKKAPKGPNWANGYKKGCDIGSAEYSGNLNTSRRLAINRARQALAAQLKVEVQSMIKDYQEQGAAGGKQFNESESTIVSRTLVDQTLVGSVPNKVEAKKAQMYAQVCIKPKDFKDAIKQMDTMSAEMRSALSKRADEAYGELDAYMDESE